MIRLKAFLDDPLKRPRDYVHLEVPQLGSVCLYPPLLSISIFPCYSRCFPTWWFFLSLGETKGGLVIQSVQILLWK